MNSRALVLIFRFLTPRELLQSTVLINKAYKAAAESDDLWAELVLQDFGYAERVTVTVTWKTEYQWRLHTRSLVRVSAGQVQLIQVPSMTSRSYRVADLLPEAELCWLWTGQLLQSGGQLGSNIQRATLLISVHTGKCTAGPVMQEPRLHHALVSLFPHVYAFGGYNLHTLASCEKLNLRANNWTALPPMSQPRRSFTPAVLGADIYLAAGNSMQLERFRTANEVFEVLGVSLGHPYASVLGVSHSDKLVFLNFKSVTELQVSAQGVKTLRKHEVPLKDWRGMAVVHDQVAYLAVCLPQESCLLDLRTLDLSSSTGQTPRK